MKKKHVIILSVIGVLVLLALTYKVERIEEVCAKTGTSVRYNRYFSLFSSPKELRPSWIEEGLREQKIEIPEYDWRRTMGEATTLLSVTNAHDRAPELYFYRYMSLNEASEQYGRTKALELAKSIATGNASERDEAIGYIKAN